MIQVELGKECKNKVKFLSEDENRSLFKGTYLEKDWCMVGEEGTRTACIGLGRKVHDRLAVREACAAAVLMMTEKGITEFSLDVTPFLEEGLASLWDVTEGVYLGSYHEKTYKKEDKTEENERTSVTVFLTGIAADEQSEDGRAPKQIIEEAMTVAKSVCFARDMVNMPGNHLRPVDFARQIRDFAQAAGVEVELLDADTLRNRGMHALLAVGDSSEYPPYLAVLRYHGAPEDEKIMGLVGKGVTCDTGGYCLKPADSMLGIKGDMAGGAAVTGAITALAANHAKVNAVAVVPICENRISPGSLLPGDVIKSYGGKTIEIGNTDAEGRLILADAVAYAVKDEKVTHILDIATLTGAVVGLLGFSIGGAICDEDSYYETFSEAIERSGERYLRIPFYEEHEKMIESRLADIRNMGEKYCGTITAGLFIRAFAEGRPWLHLDIAGTAWVDSPVFAFQSKGATGAGVTSIYQLCRGENK